MPISFTNSYAFFLVLLIFLCADMASSQAGPSGSPPLLKDPNVLYIMPSLLCLTFRLTQSYRIEALLFYSS